MKTMNTISMGVVGMAAGSALLSLATGLPLPFAILAAVSAVTGTFGASVVIAALVHPARGPLSIARVTGRFAIASPARPISRSARVAA